MLTSITRMTETSCKNAKWLSPLLCIAGFPQVHPQGRVALSEGRNINFIAEKQSLKT
jgi:hypothetical protein